MVLFFKAAATASWPTDRKWLKTILGHCTWKSIAVTHLIFQGEHRQRWGFCSKCRRMQKFLLGERRLRVLQVLWGQRRKAAFVLLPFEKMRAEDHQKVGMSFGKKQLHRPFPLCRHSNWLSSKMPRAHRMPILVLVSHRLQSCPSLLLPLPKLRRRSRWTSRIESEFFLSAK